MKLTREELRRWCGLTNAGGDLARAARLALDLMDENERLTSELDDWKKRAVAFDLLLREADRDREVLRAALRGHEHTAVAAPSPLLDDALWRREAALAAVRAGGLVGHTPASLAGEIDALLAELRRREGGA